jgi:tetratricopeptide (TPR) repeat protein
LPHATVGHNLDHVNLLNWPPFGVLTTYRPRSRLAREYRTLCGQILRYNLQDREGALSFLRTPEESDSTDIIQDLDKVLEEIRKYHEADAEVLGQLGSVYSQLGRSDAALNLYERAFTKGFASARLSLDQARLLFENGQKESALASAERVLAFSSVQIFVVNSAVRLLLKLDPERLRILPSSPAFMSLLPPERLSVVQELFSHRRLLAIAETALRQLLLEKYSAQKSKYYRIPLILCLIGQRKFDEAMHAIAKDEPLPATMPVEDAFNYGMASWGASGKLPVDCFNRVIECDKGYRLDATPNRLQCASLAYWVVGNLEEARIRLQGAREMIDSRPQSEFSAWRYLQIIPREFRKDLDEMQLMIDGAQVLPEILSVFPNPTLPGLY